MRNFFKLLLVVGVVSALVFGVFFMIHAKSDAHGSCLSTFGVRIPCERGVTPLDYVTAHMNAFATLVSQEAGMSIMLTLLLFLGFAILFIAYKFLSAPRVSLRVISTPLPTHGFTEKRRAWFARHEMRDPSASHRIMRI